MLIRVPLCERKSDKEGEGQKVFPLTRLQMFLLLVSVRIGCCAAVTNDSTFQRCTSCSCYTSIPDQRWWFPRPASYQDSCWQPLPGTRPVSSRRKERWQNHKIALGFSTSKSGMSLSPAFLWTKWVHGHTEFNRTGICDPPAGCVLHICKKLIVSNLKSQIMSTGRNGQPRVRYVPVLLAATALATGFLHRANGGSHYALQPAFQGQVSPACSSWQSDLWNRKPRKLLGGGGGARVLNNFLTRLIDE